MMRRGNSSRLSHVITLDKQEAIYLHVVAAIHGTEFTFKLDNTGLFAQN